MLENSDSKPKCIQSFEKPWFKWQQKIWSDIKWPVTAPSTWPTTRSPNPSWSSLYMVIFFFCFFEGVFGTCFVLFSSEKKTITWISLDFFTTYLGNINQTWVGTYCLNNDLYYYLADTNNANLVTMASEVQSKDIIKVVGNYLISRLVWGD